MPVVPRLPQSFLESLVLVEGAGVDDGMGGIAIDHEGLYDGFKDSKTWRWFKYPGLAQYSFSTSDSIVTSLRPDVPFQLERIRDAYARIKARALALPDLSFPRHDVDCCIWSVDVNTTGYFCVDHTHHKIFWVDIGIEGLFQGVVWNDEHLSISLSYYHWTFVKHCPSHRDLYRKLAARLRWLVFDAVPMSRSVNLNADEHNRCSRLLETINDAPNDGRLSYGVSDIANIFRNIDERLLREALTSSTPYWRLPWTRGGPQPTVAVVPPPQGPTDWRLLILIWRLDLRNILMHPSMILAFVNAFMLRERLRQDIALADCILILASMTFIYLVLVSEEGGPLFFLNPYPPDRIGVNIHASLLALYTSLCISDLFRDSAIASSLFLLVCFVWLVQRGQGGLDGDDLNAQAPEAEE